jgi:aspartate/methionine/tyrosine aminotransferase
MTRCAGDDTAYVRDLIASAGVAAIPASAFYYDGRTGPGRGLVRFAFCKQAATLRTAAERLRSA